MNQNHFVKEPGCNVYPTQKLDEGGGAFKVLPADTQVRIVPGQRYRVRTRYAIQISIPVTGWVFEDLIS